jgi:hypothetical protein
MTDFVRINRRLILSRLGKGTMALAVLGACGSNTGGSSDDVAASTSIDHRPRLDRRVDHHDGAGATTATTVAPSTGLAEYLRVDLGFVSAYLVVRCSGAAVVDTGCLAARGQSRLPSGPLTWAEMRLVTSSSPITKPTMSAPC